MMESLGIGVGIGVVIGAGLTFLAAAWVFKNDAEYNGTGWRDR